MVDKLAASHNLIQKHARISQSGRPPLCFIGFDGFTDEIIRVVDQRLDVHTFESIYTIAEFGKRIVAASGKSCNIELVPTETRLGGNAPIFAKALLEGGNRIVFAGAIGQQGNVEPIFHPFASACEKVYALGPSGHTDALEFYDGKVLLGKIGVLAEVSYESLIAQLPEEELISLLDRVDLFVSANWTMLPKMNDLWQSLLDHIVPHCSKRSEEKPRWLFVDLADTAKRSSKDLLQALEILPRFQPAFRVILGLNHSEAQQVYYALIGPPPSPGPDHVSIMAKSIRQKASLEQVVVHATKYTVAATSTGVTKIEGPYCAEPKITTGAGDHFNAGYCHGLLFGLSTEESLLVGVASSGYYVRNAKSPSIAELAAFLEKWHKLGHALDKKP